MISGQVPTLIRDQFDRPSNVHGKTGPKCILRTYYALPRRIFSALPEEPQVRSMQEHVPGMQEYCSPPPDWLYYLQQIKHI